MGDPEETVALDPTVDFIAGTVAGMTSLVVGFPFDTVKVRFQSPEIASRYRSTLHAISTIVREERFLGLYKGITSPLATVALMNGLVFASYRFFMKYQLENHEVLPTFTQIALAGAGSGIVSSIVTTPTELIKIHQQSLLVPTTARQVALKLYKEGGIRGLYRGVVATALRDCGYGAYFAAYEMTCRLMSTPPTRPPDHTSLLSEVGSDMNKLSWPTMLLAGGIAGIAGWIVTFPLDVVKTRMQGSQPVLMSVAPKGSLALATPSPSPGSPLLEISTPIVKDINPYRSIYSTIINSYRAEGIGVFFRGLSPTLIRAIPVNMVTFFTFETVARALS